MEWLEGWSLVEGPVVQHMQGSETDSQFSLATGWI